MGSKKLLAVLLVALVSVPALADARLSKDLKEELQGYVDTNKEADDAEAKQAALLTLGRIGGRDAKKALAEFKKAEDQRVKLAADMGLWLAGDRRADDSLVNQLKDDTKLYLTLREVTSVLPDDKEEALVKKLVKKVDAAKKRDIFRYLAQQHGDLYGLLEDYLVTRDDEERAAAVEAALFTARDQAGDIAKKMVDSRREGIRADGVKLAMGLTRRPGGSDKAVAALEDALGNRSEELTEKVARHLVTLGNEKGVAHMVERLAKAGDDDAKLALAKYLLDNEAKVGMEAAKPLMESKNDKLSSLGYQLAATSADAEFVGKLRQMFSETVFDKRIVAVKALGYTGNDAAVGLLGKGLFEGNDVIRLHSAKGLGRLGKEEALSFLDRALRGERKLEVKLAVIDAISRIDSKKSVTMLRYQTTASEPQVKLAVVKGIRRLGKPDGAKALKVIEQDRNLDIKWQVFLTTLELDPKQGLARMSAALRNPPDGFMADIEKLDADTRNQVVKHLLVNGNSTTRASAMSTARRSGEELFDVYRELVADAATPDNVRQMALFALAEKRDEKDKTLFEALVKSGPKPIQRTAAWTLVAYGSKDLEATFRGMLSNQDPALKSIAAYGLAVVKEGE